MIKNQDFFFIFSMCTLMLHCCVFPKCCVIVFHDCFLLLFFAITYCFISPSSTVGVVSSSLTFAITIIIHHQQLLVLIHHCLFCFIIPCCYCYLPLLVHGVVSPFLVIIVFCHSLLLLLLFVVVKFACMAKSTLYD